MPRFEIRFSKARNLGQLTREEREDYMPRLFEDMVQYRRDGGREQEWIEIHQIIRGSKDALSPHASQMRHPYAFAAAMAIHSVLFPTFLGADPPFQIEDPNPRVRERNKLTERIVASQLRSPWRSNFRMAWDPTLMDAVVFGTSIPWLMWESRHQQVGPIYERETTLDGQPMVDETGRPRIIETYQKFRTRFGPRLVHIDPWDSYIHPDGNRFIVIRDTTGHELLQQSQGDNPLYAPELVDRLLKAEVRNIARRQASSGRRADTFSRGEVFLQDRDELAVSVGAAPPHLHQMMAHAMRDVEGRSYPIYHYTDGEYTASYVASDQGDWMELRFARAASIDGTPNVLPLRTNRSPQEHWGVSILQLNLPLLKVQDRFFQAAADGAALAANPMWAASQSMVNMNPAMVAGPGVVWKTPGAEPIKNHVERLDMPTAWFQALQYLQHIQEGLSLGFAQSDVQQGRFPQGRRGAFLTQQVTRSSEARLRMLHERCAVQFGMPLIRKMVAMNSVFLKPSDYRLILGEELSRVYDPPTLREVIEGYSFVPRGSLESADTALRAQQWPGIIQTLIQALPFLRQPPVHETFRRWYEDLDIQNMERILPPADGQIETQFLQLLRSAGDGQPPPASPTAGVGEQIQAALGGTAPPGPADGRANGTAEQLLAGIR